VSLSEFKISDYLRIAGGLACLVLAVTLVFSRGSDPKDLEQPRKSSDNSIVGGIKAIANSDIDTAGQLIVEKLNPDLKIGTVKRAENNIILDESNELDDITELDEILKEERDSFVPEPRAEGNSQANQEVKSKTQEEISKEFQVYLREAELELKLDIEGVKRQENEYLDKYKEDYISDKAPERKDVIVEGKGQPFEPLVTRIKQKELSKPELDHKKIIKGLIERLYYKDPLKVVSASLALRKEAKTSDVKAISKVLKLGPPTEIKKYLIETLATVGGKEIIPALEFELEHGEKEILPFVIEALGRAESDRAVPILANVLRGNPRANQYSPQAMVALSRIGTKRAASALELNFSSSQEFLKAVHKRSISHLKKKIDYSYVEQEIPSGTILEAIFRGSNFMFYYPSQLGTLTKKPWLFVCLHSQKLEYENLFNRCYKLAKERKMAVLVPYFDPVSFPHYEELNYRQFDFKADSFLWDLIAHVGEKADIQTKKIYFYGEGKGGEMLLKLAVLKPERIARAVSVTNNVPIASEKILFPNGFGETPFFPEYKADISSFFDVDIAVMGSQKSKRAGRFFEALNGLAYADGFTMRPKRILMPVGLNINDENFWKLTTSYLFPKS